MWHCYFVSDIEWIGEDRELDAEILMDYSAKVCIVPFIGR